MFDLEGNSENLAKRIIGMMNDYDVTMFDALLWDFEALARVPNAEKFWEKFGTEALERRFRQYLNMSGVSKDHHDYYTGIFMGTTPNVELKKT